MEYKIIKLKNNVYLLKYYNKILKVSVDNQEYLSEYEAYKILIEKQNNYNVEKFTDYYEIKDTNITSYIEVKINNKPVRIKTTTLIEHEDLMYYRKEKITHINLYILAGDYKSENIIFSKILEKPYDNNINKLINNIFINLLNANKETNFHHGDFKIDNILILNNNDVSLFDLDFSLFLPEDEYLTVLECDDPKINLYLHLDKGSKIYGSFFKLFDVYLFSLNIIYYYKNIKLLKKIETSILDYIKNNDCCSYFYIFYIVYCNLLYHTPRDISEDVYLNFTKYKYIKHILKDVYKIIDENNKAVLNINMFDFIHKTINLY